MRNLVFVTGHLADGATATATVTASGYSPSNALALDRSSRSWLGVGTGAQRLIYNTPAPITPTALAIAMGNYSEWGTTKLQHSNDGVTWTDFLTLTNLPSVDGDQDYAAKLVAAPSKSWWCLYWATPVDAPEVGNFRLGTWNEISKNDSYPSIEEDVINVENDTSEGRVTVSEEEARLLMRFRMAWAKITSSVRDEIRPALRTEYATNRPFYFVPIDESGSSTSGRAYQVRYEPASLPVTRNFLNQYALQVVLIEQV